MAPCEKLAWRFRPKGNPSRGSERGFSSPELCSGDRPKALEREREPLGGREGGGSMPRRQRDLPRSPLSAPWLRRGGRLREAPAKNQPARAPWDAGELAALSGPASLMERLASDWGRGGRKDGSQLTPLKTAAWNAELSPSLASLGRGSSLDHPFPRMGAWPPCIFTGWGEMHPRQA